MNSLLTLAINKTKSGSFLVLAYELNLKKFLNVTVEDKDMIDTSGNVKWDIFGRTDCNLLKYDKYFTLQGTTIFKGYYNEVEINKLFNLINASMDRFLSPYSKDIIAVVLVRKILNIDVRINDNSSWVYRVKFINSGKDYNMIVIDNKWRSYWDSIREENIDIAKKKLMDYFNNSEKKTYIVLHKTGKDKFPYITAIHCI